MSIADVSDRKDRPAYATFHRVAVEDKAASVKAGQYVARDVDMVHVTPPYSKDVMKWRVADWFLNMKGMVAKGRMPREWMDDYEKQYEAWKRGEEPSPTGTAIKGWGVISPAQQDTLTRMYILTVEDLAGVNDEALRRIGMGGLDLKNKAVAWLAQLKDKGPLTQEVASIKSENRGLKSQVETLQGQVEALLAAAKVERGVDDAPRTQAIQASDLIDDDRNALAAKYKEKHGKAPHPHMNIETLRARVA
jgi:hypothetical protein